MSSKKTAQKRPRTKNTSAEQYCIYLQFMEEDYYFRSGLMLPSLGENYHEKKWEELSRKLNSVGDGPQRSAEEWKKRFIDWKYLVKSKFRKINSHMKQTGSGPPSTQTLSEIEERALGVWGRNTVEGTPLLTTYDGLPGIPGTSEQQQEECMFIIPDVIETEENAEVLNENTQEIIITENAPLTGSANATPKRKNPRVNTPRPKPLSVVAEKLIEATKNNESNLAERNYILKKYYEKKLEILEKIEKAKAEENRINLLRLKFEIYKFHCENPEFPSFSENIE